MAEKKSNPIWNTLSSLKLTLILLILLAITSILGTVIPQQGEAARFAQGLSPGIFKLYSSLQLFDMYHSIWFRLIICCLVLNLIICSINRFPATLKLFRLTPRPDRSKPFKDLPPQRTLSVKGERKEVSAKVMETLKGQYSNIVMKDSDKGSFTYGEKARYTLFGVYLVHLSVLFILIGAIIGSLFGFDAYVNIIEGESTDTVSLREGTGHSHKKLGFSVYCDKFSVDFYENGTPKEFKSELSFIINGNRSQRGILLVNHPITFRGITFYQASYGSSPGNKVRLRVFKNGGDIGPSIMEIELGKPVSLPGNEGQIILSDVKDDFMRMGPAVLISIKSSKGEEIRLWLFKNQDMIKKRFPEIFENFNKLNPSAYKPYTFYLDHIESRYYTGLQVKKDPGVIIVYFGFFMIMIGLFITFFTSHRTFWVRITEKTGEIRVSVAGAANKDPVGIERELDRLVNRLKKSILP
ncbi:cytochrome c biogenesis protein ResB [Thermodesulfobacteriota bacterium]